MRKTGVIHGRFQPFHNDHLKYVLEGLKHVNLLYIGITNPDPSLTLDDKADVKRSEAFANPCTFFERLQMIRNSLNDLNVEPNRYIIVPFPINIPRLWRYYAPRDATYFLTIYDEWGERKLQLLTENGLKVRVLWRKSQAEKGITATEIRDCIIHDTKWVHLVPKGTVNVIKEFLIAKRLKEIHKARET